MQSKLTLSTKRTKTGKTELDHYFVSPPFKLLALPHNDDVWCGGLNTIQMSSSPGLLAGDQLTIEMRLAPDTSLSVRTQAFTRVQSMNEGEYAEQQTYILLEENSRLFYLPHPLVLHKESTFKQQTRIEMRQGSKLIYGEIVAIGRVLNGERFAFRQFNSYLQIFSENRPLVSDRIQWLPAKMSLTALSQMEDYSHQGSLIYLNLAKTAGEIKQQVMQLQDQISNEQDMLIGVSQLNEGGLIVRVLGHRSESIQQIFEQFGRFLKAQN